MCSLVFFSESDVQFGHEFGANAKLVATRPDEGNCVVILDKKAYPCSMEGLVSEKDKILLLTTCLKKIVFRFENKLNRLTAKLKPACAICEDTYRD